jgi:hypothetical protein
MPMDENQFGVDEFPLISSAIRLDRVGRYCSAFGRNWLVASQATLW